MSSRDDDRFRVRPGAPKNRQQKFVSQVLKEVSKAGVKSVRKSGARPGARLGRGHVAARFTGRSAQPGSRRVTIKTRLVNLKQAGPRSTTTHLRYIEREGVGRDGEPGQAYGSTTDNADLVAFEERSREDRHQFRFIVSPEDAEQLDDLRTYTRHLMSRMEADLGTNLDWVAVNHWNTDNPHTHVVLRGKDDTGKDLIISRDYIAQGMRDRASELATEWLGPRTELEIQQSLRREVDQERWTSLDRTLQREAQGGLIHMNQPANDPSRRQQHVLLIGRLQRLQRMGLAHESSPGVWTVHAEAEQVLRTMGERGDIVRTMQRAMGGEQRDLAVFESGENVRPVVGRVVAKGMADELYDRGYLVIDGIDGKAHYVALNAKVELEQYLVGSVVEVRGAPDIRIADKNIAALAVDGLYRSGHHLTMAKAQTTPERDPKEVVNAHVRRLEALRRAGIVERVAEGVWRVPANLSEQGRQYDAQRLGGASVELRSHLPIERQTRVIGATWLDQQLIGGASGIADNGFGGEARDALRQRSDFLIEQGLAKRRGQRVILARNLLGTLRGREIDAIAKTIAAQTGLVHRTVADGERVTGTYRRNVQLASGRFAMIDDGMGFMPGAVETGDRATAGADFDRRSAWWRGVVGVRAVARAKRCVTVTTLGAACQPEPTVVNDAHSNPAQASMAIGASRFHSVRRWQSVRVGWVVQPQSNDNLQGLDRGAAPLARLRVVSKNKKIVHQILNDRCVICQEDQRRLSGFLRLFRVWLDRSPRWRGIYGHGQAWRKRPFCHSRILRVSNQSRRRRWQPSNPLRTALLVTGANEPRAP